MKAGSGCWKLSESIDFRIVEAVGDLSQQLFEIIEVQGLTMCEKRTWGWIGTGRAWPARGARGKQVRSSSLHGITSDTSLMSAQQNLGMSL